MSEVLSSTAAPLFSLLAAVAFFLGLKSSARVRVATQGRLYAIAGLLLATVGALLEVGPQHLPGGFAVALAVGLAGGLLLGHRLGSAATAARLAIVPALAGAAAALAAAQSVWQQNGMAAAIASLAMVVGAAAAVLGTWVSLRGSGSVGATVYAAMAAVLAGWSVALLGLLVESAILLIAGGVAGTAALSLGRIAARATGRTLPSVLRAPGAADSSGYKNVRSCGTDEAAMVLESARKVVVVPGFGMSAAQAQHAVKEVAEQLEKRGAEVVYAIHPSAGCLPGQMNFALDEANVPHEKLVELGAAQGLVAAADAVLVVGANDTVNPTAAADHASPLYGLPALDLGSARAVFVVKRSLRAGAAGVKNPLFERANTMMMFGDGKRVMQALVAELKGGGAH